MKKSLPIELFIRACQLLDIYVKYYRRYKREHKVYYIRDKYLVKMIMDIEHVNWK